MIKVKTTRFGEIEVSEEEMIRLPAGLIGFPELNRFILLDHDKDSPFKWLQSLDDGGIAFVLINPLLFKSNYSVEVTEAEVGDLKFETEDDAVISVIITMPSNPQNMTANLKAPIIFNIKNRLGKQVILNNTNYTTRHNVLEEMKEDQVLEAQTKRMQDVMNQAEKEEAALKSKETQRATK